MIKRGEYSSGRFEFLVNIIDHAGLRSLIGLLVHVCVGVALATLFYFGRFVSVNISDNNLVTVLAGITAVSGVFLALTAAFGTFKSQFQTDWAYRNNKRLRNQRERIGNMMRKSAGKYPEIASYLKDKYLFLSSYLPGQGVSFNEMNEMVESDTKFRSWVSGRVKKSGQKIDWGNIEDYDSFVKHGIDAMFAADESREVIAEIKLAELHARNIGTLQPLIMTWAIILVYSLVFAVTGSLDVMRDSVNLSILIIPIYLSFLAVIAVVLDFWNLIRMTRIREIGWAESTRGERRPHWSEQYK